MDSLTGKYNTKVIYYIVAFRYPKIAGSESLNRPKIADLYMSLNVHELLCKQIWDITDQISKTHLFNPQTALL